MKIIVTKIFYRRQDVAGRECAGYEWCIGIENDAGHEISMLRCATWQKAADWVARFNATAKSSPLPVEWHETGHFTLSQAPEYIEGTDPESEARRDAMNERIKNYMDRREP